MISGVLVGWVAGVVSTASILWLREVLADRRERNARRREAAKDEHVRRIEIDRMTHRRRITVLIRSYLAAYVRSGKWWNTRTDLERLLTSLEQGAYEHFVDVEVDKAWVALIETTTRMARRRRADKLTHDDIHEYNHARKQWEGLASRSFGPLPSTNDVSGRHAADQAAASEDPDSWETLDHAA